MAESITPLKGSPRYYRERAKKSHRSLPPSYFAEVEKREARHEALEADDRGWRGVALAMAALALLALV